MRRGLALAAMAALASIAGAASAQTAESFVADFGLFATWAQDCGKPPSKENIHSRFERKDGQVVNVHDAGPDYVEQTLVVRSAKSAGADLLTLTTVNAAGKQTDITMRRVGDRMQVWSVLGTDGFAPVKDGKYIVNDAPIAALSRCK